MARRGWTCATLRRRRERVAPAAVLVVAAAFIPSAPGAQQQPQQPSGVAGALPTVESVGVAPLPGSGLPRDRIAGNPRTLSAPDLLRDGRLGGGLTETLERASASITRNDTGGNPFQPDLQIRGFSASPLLGTPQGVAVYQNGVRINEAFGDTVQWDLIPEIAIRDLDVITGGNPLFGLNALGGAIALRMRTGFDFQGAEIDLGGGSHGRRALGLHAGKQVGNVAAYFAVEGLDDDGHRRFSPSRVRRLYGDLGWRGERATLNLSVGHGSNSLSGNGPAPVELLRQGRREVFTYPDQTRNRLLTLQARGTYALTDTLSLEATAYVREFRQRTTNGDLADVEGCEDGDTAGLLCFDDGPPVLGPGGVPLSAASLGGAPPGAVNRTGTNSTSAGGTVQAVHNAPVLGMPLRAVVGASYDHGNTQFSGSSEFGAITPGRTVSASGIILDQPEAGIAPVRLGSTNNYVGLYGSATLDVTPRVSASVGGRYNYAEIELRDRIGTALNGRHDYSRFNPAAGVTWRLVDNATAYFGYSEANRAPSPAELSCADPLLPCLLGAFFLADPPLKQVVSRTFEAGVRGTVDTGRMGLDGSRLRWNLGLFRTGLEDDILLVQSDIQGRGFFRNAGDTRRQGVEAGLSWRNDRVAFGLDYALIDATFRTGQRLPSPNNPFADEDGAILVERGDRIPGIPRHRIRFDAEWRPIPAWSIGGNVVYNSGQYLRGDEGNQLDKIDGYALVNLRTSIRVGPGVELYGLVRNLFDKRFATFGTLYDVGAAQALNLGLSDPRTVTPALPRTVFGGVRVVF